MRLELKYLKIATVLYLLIPIGLFMVFWVKPWISSFCLLGLFYSIYSYWKNMSLQQVRQVQFNAWSFFLLLFMCFWLVSYSGAGGFGIKLHDHLKTYTIMKDVMENGTPVSYIFKGEKYFLAAHLAYNLFGPLTGGFISYEWATICLFIFAGLGYFLTILWVKVISGKNELVVFFFFMLVGGLDIAGYLFDLSHHFDLKSVFKQDWSQLYWYNSLQNSDYLLYHGNVNLLFWAPPHSLPAWLISGIFFYELIIEKNLTYSPLYLFCAVFWSPFILVGLATYFIYYLLKNGLSRFFRWSNFALIPIFTVLLLFVNSIAIEQLDKGFIFHSATLVKDIFHYAWFVFFEVGLWLLLVWQLNKEQSLKPYLWIATICLLAIPMYKLGKYNDFVQRVSIPSLFLLWMMIIKGILPKSNSYLKIAFTCLLLLGSLDSLGWLYSSMKVNGLGFKHEAPKYELIGDSVTVSEEQGWPVEQILAKPNSLFFKYLARENDK